MPSLAIQIIAFVGLSAASVASASDGVTYRNSTHRLHYVPSVDDINYTAVGVAATDFEDVPAFEMENNVGIKVKAIARGGSLVELIARGNDLVDLSSGGSNYLWENVEGATYYGAETNNFPLRRGLIVHGGIHMAAVCPEHGLYYDTDWVVSVDDSNPDEKSITFTIVDDEATRYMVSNTVPTKPAYATLATGFSSGPFNRGADAGEMTRYPVTDMTFKFTITLRKDEDFVRLRMSVTNDSTDPKWAEAWLPMAFPITEDSIILSNQQQRWRRDNWCLDDVTPNMVEWEDYPFLHKPLDWPMGCIFYDFPSVDGRFHGVTTNPAEGKGVVYFMVENTAHYTKLWSWGKQGEGNDLVGRPASDYYEPWNGVTSFAFFQTYEFEPQSEVFWELAILPITEGLTSTNTEELLSVVDAHIDERLDKLGSLLSMNAASTFSTTTNVTKGTTNPATTTDGTDNGTSTNASSGEANATGTSMNASSAASDEPTSAASIIGYHSLEYALTAIFTLSFLQLLL